MMTDARDERLVSVMITVYNGAAYLAEAIESVLDRAVMLQAGRLTMIDQSDGSLRDRYRHASVNA